MLEVRELSRSFGGLRAVDNVTFDVEAGSITAVIGPNGAGKTTLFNCICGSIRPNGGAVRYKDASIYGLPPHAIAAAGVSRTFQNVKIFPHMSVIENVLVGRHRCSRAGFVAGMFMLPWSVREEKEHRERALAILEWLGVAHLADAQAGSLAFGQQRAVELARALATEPQLLLLDEPAAGLNIHETAEVGRQIGKIRDQGITVLLVEHDMSLVMDISDKIVVLSNGQRIAQGPPREIQRDPEVIKVYLGGDDA
ncbi:MAG: ATP-binding cassette domain-containing protein [Chitinivibrionales bacterium]|nr:ATP-binding cassette domain-containing protein [Chitinivibrionales bacterium]